MKREVAQSSGLLIGTLGGSWTIIPEVLGFTNPTKINLFKNHPDITGLTRYLNNVDEVWLITTDNSELVAKGVEKLILWRKLVGNKAPIIRIWAPKGVVDLCSDDEIRASRDFTLRLALLGCEKYGHENVSFCLAGGRKTMSSDLQQAATLFGTKTLIHLINTDILPPNLYNPKPEKISKPLSIEEAMLFQPVIIDHDLPKSELVGFRGEKERQSITSSRFPLPIADENGKIMRVSLDNELQKTLMERKSRARRMLFNYAESIYSGKSEVPFSAMHVLPPDLIDVLRKNRIGCSKKASTKRNELSWLKKLPKTDLHCHLGGVAAPEELLKIVKTMQQELLMYEKSLKKNIDTWHEMIINKKIVNLKSEIMMPDEIRLKQSFSRISRETGVPIWAVCGWLITSFDSQPDLLKDFIFGDYKSESSFIGIDISNYELLGDLQGSCLLQTEKAIRGMCKVLIEKCRNENVRYIEVRCSPINYSREGLDESEVVKIIQNELGKGSPEVKASLIFIGSRHGRMSDLWRHVELAQEVVKNKNDFGVPLVGFDLAGDERFDAENFVTAFRPLFERCLHITVHAGETQSANSMWKAVYPLHAERIGHGLKLCERKDLMTHFLDRGIGIEMCPSSNRQIVGYKDSELDTTSSLQTYPLKEYLQNGLKVCVNTDNPGISMTNPTLELYNAARLTEGGLSYFEILTLIKNAFSSSFACHSIRKELLLAAEKDILNLLRMEQIDH